MNVLITYCHPNPKSFAAAITNTLVETAQAEGHNIKVRDLYQEQFYPVLSASDFIAFKSGNIPEDILKEQDYIEQAELLVFVYPLWWTGLPAMLKGYIDRVYRNGFAYTYTPQGPLGLLKGKKALLVTNSGTPKEIYLTSGMYNSLNQTSDNGIFEFCGIEVLDHIYFDNVPASSPETLKSYLEKAELLIKKYLA